MLTCPLWMAQHTQMVKAVTMYAILGGGGGVGKVPLPAVLRAHLYADWILASVSDGTRRLMAVVNSSTLNSPFLFVSIKSKANVTAPFHQANIE